MTYLAKSGPDLFDFGNRNTKTIIKTNIKKQYQQTAGLIQRLINISHLLSIGVTVAETFCLRKYVFVVYKFVLHGKQFLAKQTRGME